MAQTGKPALPSALGRRPGGTALGFFGAQAGDTIASGVVRRASVPVGVPDAAGRLARELGPGLAHAFVFSAPGSEFRAMAAALDRAFDCPVTACTTAGEIDHGYVEGEVLAIGLPAAHFRTVSLVVPDLNALDGSALITDMIRQRRALETEARDFASEFAFLLVDGTSAREDMLMELIGHGLGTVPLFGGSAADGTRFDRSLLAHRGQVMERGAVLTFVRSDCPIKVFSFHHLDPGDIRMVVTGADPAARLVREINGEPAAREYARLLGKDPAQLGPFTFAAHPLVVRVGGQYFVRSIQRVTEEGHLKFFSAIDEGVVLTVAALKDIAAELDHDLTALSDLGRPDTILACDCLLRRIAAEQTQKTRDVSRILSRHNVVGFSTYGEQFGAMHVNLTMTGVAIYPARQDD